MSDISEQARAEAERQADVMFPEAILAPENEQRAEDYAGGFMAGVEWAASLTPEPSEDVSTGLAGLVDVSKIGPKVDTSEASEDVWEALARYLHDVSKASLLSWDEYDGLIDLGVLRHDLIRNRYRGMADAILSRFTVTPKPTNDSEGENQ